MSSPQGHRSGPIPMETRRQYVYRRFLERFRFAWMNRCWRCLRDPWHMADSTQSDAKVWTCDGCSCWTDRPVTRQELWEQWGWIIVPIDDGDPAVAAFCPECH